MSFLLSSLIHYPVKSLRGNVLQTMMFDAFGPQLDRRYMLVDSENRFITQRIQPRLSLLSATFDGVALSLSLGAEVKAVFPQDSFCEAARVRVWHDEVEAQRSLCDAGNAWLSDYLGVAVTMVFMPDTSHRQVDREFFNADRKVSFADGFPVLLANEASLANLNSRLADAVTMQRFRPNIVFAGDHAFQEDNWSQLRIGPIEFAVVKPCSRCVMTTVDDEGRKGREPLKTLSGYRKNDFGVCFGQNLVPLSSGKISLSDRLDVIA